MNADWLVPDWPVPAGVRALCTSRSGGVSVGRYGSLNLGDHVADEAVAVAQNRSRLAQAMGARPVLLQQVHGAAVAQLQADTPDGVVADACVSAARALACTVMVADCLPLLFTTRAGTVVAAAHAGWRGLAAGVLEATLHALWERSRAVTPGLDDAALAADTLAWLGPCIGPQAFEVGAEVRAAFVGQHGQAAHCFNPLPGAKYLGDLAALARQRLLRLGVTQVHGNDGSLPWCTVANPSRFFSHRRDGVSGRMAACIWLE